MRKHLEGTDERVLTNLRVKYDAGAVGEEHKPLIEAAEELDRQIDRAFDEIEQMARRNADRCLEAVENVQKARSGEPYVLNTLGILQQQGVSLDQAVAVYGALAQQATVLGWSLRQIGAVDWSQEEGE